MATSSFLSFCCLILFLTVSNARTRLTGSNSIFPNGKGEEVFVKTISQRNQHLIEFQVDRKNFTLNLTLSDRKVFSSDIPVWLLKSAPKSSPNYTYELLNNDEKKVDGDIYVDTDKGAVILARYDTNKREMLYDGVFGEGKQKHIMYSLTGRNITKRGKKIGGDHVIYSTVESDDEDIELPDLGDVEIMLENGYNDDGEKLEKLSTPLKIMYPKILVVIDNHLFKKFKKNIKETLKYMNIFWNKADQKYELIKSPKVNLVVTGIIIANHETVPNYIYQSRQFDKTIRGDLADAEKILIDARKYFLKDFYEDTKFNNYDAVILLTPFDLEISEKNMGSLAIGGLASSIGKVCDRGYNVAVTFDRKDYSGIIVAVHELGHMLNLHHDGTETICSGGNSLSELSIMSNYSPDAQYFWSNCSLDALTRLSTYQAAECLRKRSRD